MQNGLEITKPRASATCGVWTDIHISRAETTSFDLGRKPSFLSWDDDHDGNWLDVINFNNRVVSVVDFYSLPGKESLSFTWSH